MYLSIVQILTQTLTQALVLFKPTMHAYTPKAEAEVARRFENCEVKTCVLERRCTRILNPEPGPYPGPNPSPYINFKPKVD